MCGGMAALFLSNCSEASDSFIFLKKFIPSQFDEQSEASGQVEDLLLLDYALKKASDVQKFMVVRVYLLQTMR